MHKNKVVIIASSIVVLVLIAFGGIFYYQASRFNSHVSIDNVKVGGMTVNQALAKLEGHVSKNIVYLGQKIIYDGKDTSMGFTSQDVLGIQKLLKEQRTLFPSSKARAYTLKPSQFDSKQSQAEESKLKEALQELNAGLQPPKDATADLDQGKIVVSKSESGQQYDVAKLLKEFQGQAYDSEIQLQPVIKQPVKATSPVIQDEKKKLEDLLQETVNYKLQNKDYAFKASEVIQNASVTADGKYQIDDSGIKAKLNALNQSLSTLNKNYIFKTHSGSVISVKGQSYGWAIDVNNEAKRIEDAFIKNEKSILAYNIYGVGWNINGVGYHNPTNHGIGNTYVEVSIKDQQIWGYKNGKLVVTTHVVTGTHKYNEDTPKGVWYIEYKQSPSTLKGSEVGNSNYSVKVKYWAPFTMGGVGFHDASWRSNWSSTAYLANGSGGCVNTPPSVMKKVYDNLEQNEPVIVY